MKAITFQGNDLIPHGVVNWPEKPMYSFDSAHYISARQQVDAEYEEACQQALASAVPFDREEDIKKIPYYLQGVKAQYASHHEPQDEFYLLTESNRKEAEEFGDIVQIQPNTPCFLDLEWHVEEVECKMCNGSGRYEIRFDKIIDCNYCQGTGKRSVARLN